MRRPSPNGSNSERDAGGRFRKGNPGGPGNPHAGRVAQLRSALLNAVSDGDVQQIIAALVKSAKSGDTAAAKIVFDYTVGKPRPHDDELMAMVDARSFVFEFRDNLPPKSRAR